MKRSEFKREIAHADQVLDATVALLNVRFPSMVRFAVEREFSSDAPSFIPVPDSPQFAFPSRAIQETAKAIYSAAIQRAVLYVARAVAERLASGDGQKWVDAKNERFAREQREFDEYKRNAKRESLAHAERRARLQRMRSGMTEKSRSVALQRAAVEARIEALRLRGIQ